MTGILKYMAIEVLGLAFRNSNLDLDHTYRYDLESFFYVFLDVCIAHRLREVSKQVEDPLAGGTWALISRLLLRSAGRWAREVSRDLS